MFYETVDDITADAGIRVRATNLRELVCKVLLATFNEITDIDRVREREVREVEADGGMPFVLADLINAALLIHGSDGFVACRCE
ncbi:MAG TPA: archease, partial [Aquificaceae bacterium]|nr:archease [Aquificaceae bacterium]